MNETVLLILSILVFARCFLFSEEGAIGVALKEGTLTLPDKTQISIGDSFESLKSLSPRYLEKESRSGQKLHALTSSSSIIFYNDYENEEIIRIDIYLYLVDDDSWTEIEKVEVEGVDSIIEVNPGMRGKELIDILEKLGLVYTRHYLGKVVVDLENYYKVKFKFLYDSGRKLEDMELVYMRTGEHRSYLLTEKNQRPTHRLIEPGSVSV